MKNKLLLLTIIRLQIEEGVDHLVFFERGSGKVAFIIGMKQRAFEAALATAVFEHQNIIANLKVEVTDYWPDECRFWITMTDEDGVKYYYQAEKTIVY